MNGIKRYEFTDDDFASLSFPVHQIKNRSQIMIKWPVLESFPEFNVIIKPLSLTRMFKFIVFMYDYNSPLRMQIDDWRHRKINAMWLAGYEMSETGVFPSDVNDVLLNMNPEVLDMTFRYCRITKGTMYATLVALHNGYQNALVNLAKGDAGSLKVQKSIQIEIDDIMIKLLGGDNQGEIKSNFLDYVDMDSLGIRPEEIAFAMQEGHPILIKTSPYNRRKRSERLTQDVNLHMQDLNTRYGIPITTD